MAEKRMKMTQQEREWRAESDASALMRAEEIRGDKARMSMAQTFAEKMAKAAELNAQKARAVAKPMQKPAVRRKGK